jgi:hypothetical protein
MGEGSFSPDERWCFPEAPPPGPVADRARRWCFPGSPSRGLLPDPGEPWCFPEGPPRPRGVRPRATFGKVPADRRPII